MGLYNELMQGTTVRVEFGDATTTADPVDAHTISRSFPHTYGQPLAHFLRATAEVPDAQIITQHLAIRSTSVHINSPRGSFFIVDTLIRAFIAYLF